MTVAQLKDEKRSTLFPMEATSLPSHLALAPYEYRPHHTAFLDFIDLMQVCSGHAQNAALQERQRAAHGLFQTALRFYACAVGVSESVNDNFCQQRLCVARQQLDDCAHIVYFNDRAPFIFSEELLRGH